MAVDLVPDFDPPNDNDVIENFFLCFSTTITGAVHSFMCESFSPFFDIRVKGSTTTRRRRNGAEIVPHDRLVTPTDILEVSSNTYFLTGMSTSSRSNSPQMTSLKANRTQTQISR